MTDEIPVASREQSAGPINTSRQGPPSAAEQACFMRTLSNCATNQEAMDALVAAISAMRPDELIRAARIFHFAMRPGSPLRERMVRELAAEIQHSHRMSQREAMQAAERQTHEDFRSLEEAMAELEQMIDPSEEDIRTLLMSNPRLLAVAARAKSIFTRLVEKHIGILAGLFRRGQRKKAASPQILPYVTAQGVRAPKEAVQETAQDEGQKTSLVCEASEPPAAKKKDLILESGIVAGEECREEEVKEHKQELQEEEEAANEKHLMQAIHAALEELSRISGVSLNYSPAVGNFLTKADMQAFLAEINMQMARARVDAVHEHV